MHFQYANAICSRIRSSRVLSAGISMALAAAVATTVAVSPFARAVPIELGDGVEASDAADASMVAEFENVLLTAFATRSREPIDIERFGYDDFVELRHDYSAVVQSHPELFDVESSCDLKDKNNKTQVVKTITPCYALEYSYSDEQILQMRQTYMAAIADAMSWVPANGTDLEKAKGVYDWLCAHVSYDKSSFVDAVDLVSTSNGRIDNGRETFWAHHAYGALVEHSCVCDGYAFAFKVLMGQLGMDAEVVEAHQHAWDIVRIDNNWYHVDATWDAERWGKIDASGRWNDDGRTPHGFFLKSDDGIRDMEGTYLALYGSDDGVSRDIVHCNFRTPDSMKATDTTYDHWINQWNDDMPMRVNAQQLILPENQVTDFCLDYADGLRLPLGQSRILKPMGLNPSDANPAMAKWSSDNPAVVTFFGGGKALAMGEGTATVTCDIGGVERSCQVTVTHPVRSSELKFHSPIVDQTGRIGICLPVELPDLEGVDWSTCQLKVRVGGRDLSLDYGDAQVTRDQYDNTIATFTVPLSSLEMAQRIEATLCYEQNGQQKELRSKRTTLEGALDALPWGERTKLTDAIGNLGYAAQCFFPMNGGWDLVSRYAEMTYRDHSFDSQAVLDALASVEFVRDLGTSAVQKVTATVRLESSTTLDVNVYLKELVDLKATATFDGKSVRPTKVNAKQYRFRVSGIAAQDLMKTIEVKGNAGGAFSLSLSPMVYVKSMLAAYNELWETDYLMCALYDYHIAAKAQNEA